MVLAPLLGHLALEIPSYIGSFVAYRHEDIWPENIGAYSVLLRLHFQRHYQIIFMYDTTKIISGQIKKISVFRVTQPYLNLQVKPRIFLVFLEKIKFYSF